MKDMKLEELKKRLRYYEEMSQLSKDPAVLNDCFNQIRALKEAIHNIEVNI